MNADILCTLLAQRIPAEQFQLWGTHIHWMSDGYGTPENITIVAEVIKNYDSLSTEYITATKDSIEKEILIQSQIRELAIAALTSEGKITPDGKIANIKLESN